jgi:hypothetical protein
VVMTRLYNVRKQARALRDDTPAVTIMPRLLPGRRPWVRADSHANIQPSR